jgi:hypothetical protein
MANMVGSVCGVHGGAIPLFFLHDFMIWTGTTARLCCVVLKSPSLKYFFKKLSLCDLTVRSTEHRPVGNRQGTWADPSHAPHHLVSSLDECVRADVSRPKDGQTVAKDAENVTTCYVQVHFSVFRFNHLEMKVSLKICDNN